MTMKMLAVSLLILAAGAISQAQLKSQDEGVSAAESLVRPAPASFLGLLNPDNFMMRHNFSFGYFSGGGQGVSLASYTNSMFYRIADPLNLRLDLTLQGSPFGQRGFGAAGGQGNFNKLFISNAELNYRPADNMFLKLQFSQRPFGGYRSNYYNDFYYDDFMPYGTMPGQGNH